MTALLTKSASYLREAQQAAAAARAIPEKAVAEGRDMTPEEKADFTRLLEDAKAKNELRLAAVADEAVLAEAKALSEMLGLDTGDVEAQAQAIAHRDVVAKSLGAQITESSAFTGMMKSFGGRIPDGPTHVNSSPIQFKSLISTRAQKALLIGGSATSAGAFVTPDRTDIFELLGRRPLTIRDLISVRRTTSDTVEYVVQTAHTNNAAIVPEATSSAAPTTGATSGAALVLDPNGGYKPEGSWTFAEATATVRTIAEWVPATKRALADVAQLEGLINDELVRDLAEAEEAQVLNGSGTGNNITGILATSGIQTHAKGADTILDALRKAITKARTVGRVAPNAFVLNPADLEKIDLLKDAQQQYLGSGPFSGLIRTAWGVPLVESEAQPAGTGLLGDFSKAVLWDRENATVTMTNSHADFFIRNLVAILAEERVAFAVTRPTAFVTVTGL